MLNEQSKHIAYIVKHAHGPRPARASRSRRRPRRSGSTRSSSLARLAQDFLEECTPGYYNNEGKPGERSGQNGFYGGGSVEFFQILQEWRAKGGLEGLELR